MDIPIFGYVFVLISVGVIFLFVYVAIPPCHVADFKCLDTYFTEHTVGVRLVNDLAQPVYIAGASIELDKKGYIQCSYDATDDRYAPNEVIDIILYNCQFPSDVRFNERYKFTIKLKTWTTSKTFSRSKEGTIRTELEHGIIE